MSAQGSVFVRVGLRFAGTAVYPATGTFVKADYPGLAYVRPKVQAAGGGSGGAQTTTGSQAAVAGGGGGGGYGEKLISVGDLAASEDVIVGAAGAAGTAGDSAGGAGGTSSFGTHVIATG